MTLTVEFFAVSGLFNGAIALAYGLYILFQKNRNIKNLLFFLTTLAVAVWGVSYWQWLSSDNIQDSLFWVRALSVGSFFIPVFYLHWFYVFIENFYANKKTFLFSTYLLATSATFLIGTSLVISGMEEKMFFQFWPNPGPLYGITIFVLYILVPTYTCYTVVKIRKFANEKYKKSLDLILVATIIGFLSGLTNFPLWYDIQFPPYGTFFNALFPLLFGYGSLRHNFFNVKTITAELLVGFIIVVLFVETLLSDTQTEYILRTIFLLTVGTLGYLLIVSTHKEVENREKGERLARYLANANARLRELDKQKTEFVSIASHQLRSPIAAIKGYTSLVMEGSYGDVPEHLNMPLKRILESGQRISIMVDDFLNVTRIEQGRMSYDMKPHNVCLLINDVAQELRVVAEENNLQLTVVCDEKADIKIKADEGKIKQIFSNLIDNAIKYTQEGSIEISVRKVEPEHKVLIQFKDTGIGIDPEEVSSLFQKFNRASNANKTNVLGTGLGLYIAKEILKAHEGWVAVESEGIGKGSTFTVQLPACEERNYTIEEKADKTEKSQLPTS